MAGLLQGVEAAEDVVASDVGDAQVVAAACDQFAGRVGQPGGVESSGVDDEPILFATSRSSAASRCCRKVAA